MIIEDRVYGRFDIRSKAILELIASRPMQRLKGIAQYGIPDEFYHAKNYSRYEHSVGVMLLLKQLGAAEEEQIAGLLHDVSHTAFSHVIDWVVGSGKTEDYQDEQHARYIARTDIPAILQKHGYSSDRIVDYHHFGLLERDHPDLCADRVDYTLRELPRAFADICLPAMKAVDGRIAFTDTRAALQFAETYLKQQMEFWGGFESVVRYRLFANVLRKALRAGVVTELDFWQDDAFVVRKLLAWGDKELDDVLKIMRNKSLAHLEKGSSVAEKKFRYVDPLVAGSRNELVRLSEMYQDFARKLAEARETNRLGITLPLVAEMATA